jgi:hypothetical protein
MPSFRKTLTKELLSLSLVFGSLGIAIIYIVLYVFLINMRLLTSAFSFQLFFSLLIGLPQSLSPFDVVLTIITALLVGINSMLIIRTIYVLEHKGKVHVSIGGATIVSLVTTGCGSCGLSLISVLGLSASLSFLPFHGLELHIASIILLIFSIWYMLHQLHNGLYCRIKQQES